MPPRWFVRHIYLPVAQSLIRGTSLQAERSLAQTQHQPLEVRAAENWERLRHLLQAAGRHVPFYRDRWAQAGIQADDIRTPDDFRRLPLLTRDDLITHREDLLNPRYQGERYWVETSGSTGRPIRIRQTRRFHSWTEATQWRARSWFGVQVGDPWMAIWGRPVKSRREQLSLSLRSGIKGIYHVSAFDLTEERMGEIWARTVRHQPRLLYGYASALFLLAQWVERQGLDGRLAGLRVVMTTAEMLYGFQRDLMTRVFGVPVSNVYGCGEVGAFAHECPAGRMHVSDETMQVEYLDRQGQPAAAGETADLILTSLFNEGMPLIRYQVGDAGSWLAGPCPCGRTLPVMSVTVGKTGEMVRTVGGRAFSTELFDYIHKDLLKRGITGVRQFRVVQNSLDRFVVECVADAGTAQATLEAFVEGFRQALGADVSVELSLLPELPRDATGKLRYFLSRLSGIP
ncbi:MAG TPA: hypothetical protein VGO93_30940 [Candidatus Xenobia bacterium]|jgi:phenylacetate-CoA ligase